MPDMDGYEIVDRISKAKPRMRLAVMTGFGYNPKHTLVKIKEDHDCPCVFKPFNRAKVLEMVEKAFQQYNGNVSD